MNQKLNICLLTAVCLSLTACSSSDDQDINKFIAETKQNAKSRIEKIPNLGKMSSIKYTYANLDSPFSNKNILGVNKAATTLGGGIPITNSNIINSVQAAHLPDQLPGQLQSQPQGQPRPDADRKREFLESSPLTALKMIGTLAKNHHYWALISDAANKIHIVGINDYLGENSGQVINITEDKVILKEIVADGQGGWMSKEANINLTRKGN